MRPRSVFIGVLCYGTLVIVAASSWLDPNWRHELTNAVMAWIVVGFLAVALPLGWLLIKKVPALSLLAAVSLGAAVGACLAAILWTVVPREDVDASTSSAALTPPVTSVDEAQVQLAPIQDAGYRMLVAEVIHAFEPKAHITVGGAVLGPDGARTVDIQVASIGGSAPPRITAVDVIDRSDGRPVEIEAVDSAESKRRDLGVETMLICSDTGFSQAAIRKAKRIGLGLISAVRQGDSRAGAVIEEEIYLRRITVTPVRISYDLPKVQPGVQRSNDPPIKEHDLKYRGASLDAWVEARFVHGIGGVTVNGPVTFYYRLKKPTNFDLPGRRKMRVTKVSISTEVAIQWLSQVVPLDATNAIYDYVRGRFRLGPGENKYVIKGVDWDKAISVAEPPLVPLNQYGLTRGEVTVALMYVKGGPIGAKGSPEIDALIEPEDLRTDPLFVFPARRQ